MSSTRRAAIAQVDRPTGAGPRRRAPLPPVGIAELNIRLPESRSLGRNRATARWPTESGLGLHRTPALGRYTERYHELSRFMPRYTITPTYPNRAAIATLNTSQKMSIPIGATCTPSNCSKFCPPNLWPEEMPKRRTAQSGRPPSRFPTTEMVCQLGSQRDVEEPHRYPHRVPHQDRETTMVIVIDEIPNCSASVMTSATTKVTNTNVSAFSGRCSGTRAVGRIHPARRAASTFDERQLLFVAYRGRRPVLRRWRRRGRPRCPGACVLWRGAPMSAMEWLAAAWRARRRRHRWRGRMEQLPRRVGHFFRETLSPSERQPGCGPVFRPDHCHPHRVACDRLRGSPGRARQTGGDILPSIKA